MSIDHFRGIYYRSRLGLFMLSQSKHDLFPVLGVSVLPFCALPRFVEGRSLRSDYMKMISGGVVHMAKMAVYCSSYTNGVAALHTEILKNDVLKDWYQLFPEKFFRRH